jgi:phosphate uptake regulator
MSSTKIKKYLHKQIDELYDNILQEIYVILQSYSKEGTDLKLISEQIKELEKRKQKHLSGESKSYTWQEVMDRLKK